MKNRRSLLNIAKALLLVWFADISAGTITSSSAAAEKPNGWLQKRNFVGYGMATCSTSPDGYVLTNSHLRAEMICAPPKWSIVSINHNKKIFFMHGDAHSISARASYRILQAVMYKSQTPTLPWKHYRDAKFLGHPVEIWRSANMAASGNANSEKFVGYEFWTAKDILIPPTMAKYERLAYLFPPVDGLPVRLFYLSPKNRPKEIIETSSIEPCVLRRAALQIPTGYKETHNEREIGTNTAGLESMMDDFGFGAEAKK